MLAIMIADKMSELAIAKGLGPAQLQSFTKEINTLLVGLLQEEFDAIGMTLIDFAINMSLHPDSLKVVTNMGYGTTYTPVSYTHLRAHETVLDLVCRLLLEKKKQIDTLHIRYSQLTQHTTRQSLHN